MSNQHVLQRLVGIQRQLMGAYSAGNRCRALRRGLSDKPSSIHFCERCFRRLLGSDQEMLLTRVEQRAASWMSSSNTRFLQVSPLSEARSHGFIWLNL